MKPGLRSDLDICCDVTQLWQRKAQNNFNAISIGQVFSNSSPSLVMGHEDGVVRVFSLPKATDISKNDGLQTLQVLETKGGPIQALAIHDVTKLNNNDITVADSRGMVTIFSQGQILTRKSVSGHCIHCLAIQQDILGHSVIVTGDQRGHVTAFSPFTDLWRIRLGDQGPSKTTVLPGVTCLHAVELIDSGGQRRSYILASDSSKRVHFIQKGSIVLTISTPAVITAMSSGRFIDPDDIDAGSPGGGGGGGSSTNPLDIQVAMGTDTGAVYIMSNFQMFQEEYCNLQQTLTCLRTLPAADNQSTDTLICAGYFDALFLLRNGKEIHRQKTPAWVNCLITADINNDGIKEIVYGCHDNSIHGLQIRFS